MTSIFEHHVETAALEWLEALGWTTANGPNIAPDAHNAERDDYTQVFLGQRLVNALQGLNPELPPTTIEHVCSRLTHPEGATTVTRNRAFHRMLVDGVPTEYRAPDGTILGARAKVIDFENPANNNWLAVNQFTVTENQNTRRTDLVLFVNGLPLTITELKNPTDPDATIWDAWQQLQTYKAELPTLFSMNELLIVSDGMQARVGTLTAGQEWFKRWRTISGEELADENLPQLQVMLEGICEPTRFLSLIRDFIVFEDDGAGDPIKKTAGYHQFHAVQNAVSETFRAAHLQHDIDADSATAAQDSPTPNHGGETGDQRIGVVWHTQGAGKSLTMAFYTGAIVREPAMANPTIVVLTDRNDLDDQLFGTFSRCQDLLRQPPVQADTRADLRSKLNVQAGGVVFTTIQKFFPEQRGDTHPTLSERRNIVVIADEAHRSQYDFIDGYARHIRDALPNASFIGFTGTPIELEDANTRAVFGDYISIYDVRRSVEDQATVPIYYEGRLAQLELDESEKPNIDPDFEEATEGEELESKERLKTKWAQLEVIVGTEKRIKLIAQDIINHFEQRLEAIDGKAMVVCMSRRICVDLYRALTEIRPNWHHNDDDQGTVKVVMTGSASDPADWQQHIRSKARRESLAHRFRNADDPLRVVLVRDMWLTGFDAPCLHTMYVDKPMRGHGLMQAIARVNRVFKDKPGGLVVDYLGLAQELQQALHTYTASGGTGTAAFNQDDAVAVMQEKYEVCCGMFHGFDWSNWTRGAAAQLALLPAAQNHILGLDNGKDRLNNAVRDLSHAFALSVPRNEALQIRDDVGFFQTVRAALMKKTPGETRTQEELDLAVRQIVSRAVASEDVIDIFAAAGLEKPDISVLSDEFLDEIRRMPRRNLAAELLEKLLKGEIAARRQNQRRASKIIRRSLRTSPARVSQPDHRSCPSHRRAHRTRQAVARSTSQRREHGPTRRRAGFLRRTRHQPKRS